MTDFREELEVWCPELTEEHANLVATAFSNINAERTRALRENEELKRERDAQYAKLVELQTQLKANTLEKRLNELEVIIKDTGGVSEKIEKLQEKIGRLDV